MERCYILKNGQSTTDPRLDRIKEVDIRSLSYPVSNRFLPDEEHNPRSYTWAVDAYLDQGSEGACVGFGWAHELAARPARVPGMDYEFAREKIYWEAQKIDSWEGGSYPGGSPFYEGTSVLAGAKVVKNLGLIESYDWALTFSQLYIGIAYHGPSVIGVDWYEGMYDTDTEGFIHPTGGIAGGHALLAYRVKIMKRDEKERITRQNIDFDRSFFGLWNSWGPDWGDRGTAKITFTEMMKLWPGGDFCFPKGRTTEG